MNKKWLSALLIVAAVIFAGGAVFSVVMTAVAVRFSEWGRVLVYGFAALVCLEAAVLSLTKSRNKDKA